MKQERLKVTPAGRNGIRLGRSGRRRPALANNGSRPSRRRLRGPAAAQRSSHDMLRGRQEGIAESLPGRVTLTAQCLGWSPSSRGAGGLDCSHDCTVSGPFQRSRIPASIEIPQKASCLSEPGAGTARPGRTVSWTVTVPGRAVPVTATHRDRVTPLRDGWAHPGRTLPGPG